MNKIYKVIWNSTLGTWVAVSEMAKGKTKTKSSSSAATVGSAVFTLMVTFSPMAEAAWVNGGGNGTSGMPTSGSGTTAQNVNDVALGNGSVVNNIDLTQNQTLYNTRLGTATGTTYASGAQSIVRSGVAIGSQNSLTVGGGIAIGSNNTSNTSFSSVLLGLGNMSTGTGFNVALGMSNNVANVGSVGIGVGTQATSDSTIAVGRFAYAQASNAMAFGLNSTANAISAIAMGATSIASGQNAVAIGSTAQALGTNALSIGVGNVISGNNSGALGSGNTITTDNTYVVGNNVTVNTAANTVNGNVILGNASADKAYAQVSNSTINGKTYNYQGTAKGVVSVGAVGAERQIVNVAPGAVKVDSTDAINGSQLFQTNQELANVAANTAAALGGGATANTTTGGITTPTYAVLTDPNTGATTNVNNVGAAISSLNAAIQKPITFTGDSGTTSNKLNSSFAIVGDTNIATAVTAGQVKVQLKPSISLTSVTTTDGAGNSTVMNATGTKVTDSTGNTNTSTSTSNVLKQGTNTLTTLATGTTVSDGTNTTTLNASGVSITNGPSMITSGINAGNKAISNVLAGSALTDAVNVSQLNAVKANADNLGNTTAAALGGGSSYSAATGALTAPSYSVVSNPNGLAANVTGVAAALNSLNTAVTTPLYFKDAGTGTSSNKLGSTFAIVGDSNITTAVTANQAQIKLNPDITLKSVTTTDGAGNSTVMNATGTKITDTTGNTNTSTSTSNVLKQGTNTLTTLATGTTVSDGTNTTTLNASGVSITNGPSMTTSGINAGNKVISNVLAGSALTDAVNVSQLNAVKANADNLGNTTAAALGGGSSYNAATGALTAPSYSVVSNPNGLATNVTGVAAALNSLNTAVTTPLYFKDAGTGTSSNKLGSSFAIVGDSNITTAVTANQAQIKLNPDITLKSVTTTDGAGNSSVLNGAGLVVSNAEGSTTISTDGISIANGPNLTSNGLDLADAPNGITNLANGVVSATSKDGINGSQLWEAQSNLATLLGGKSQISNSDGTVTTSDIGGTGKNNINDAIQYVKTQAFNPLTFTGDSGSSTNQLGSTLAITGDSNITTAASQGKVAVTLNKAITVDSVNAGGVTVDKNGLNAGGVTVGKDGINANGQTITGVKDGAAASDAVNKGQLDAANAGSQAATDALGNSIAQNLGGASTYKDGVVTAPNYQITDLSGKTNTATNVGDALSSLNTAVTTPLTFTGDSGSSTNKLGTSLAVVGDDNITTTASQGQIAVALNKAITVDSVNAGGVTVDKNGINANGQTITGVKDGAAASDAVNKGQLDAANAGSQAATDALGKSLAQNLGGASTYKDGVVTAPNYQITDLSGKTNTATNVGDALSSLNTAVTTPLTFTGDSGSSTNKLGTSLAVVGDENITTTASQGQIAVALNKAITVDSVNAGGVTVDKNGINANGQSITGVKDGLAASDAVNKGQLDAANAGSQAATDALGNSLAQNLGGASTYKDGVVTAPNYQITDLSGKTNTATNVGDALSSLNTAVTTPLTFTGDSGSSTNKLGTSLAVVGDDNITTTASQGQIAVALNKAITVDSVNAGGVTVDKNGINANGQSITGVKDGLAASDAVNKGQLDAANAGSQAATDALGNSLAQNLGGASTYKDGVVTAPNYQITDLSGKTNTATNVGDALGSLNTAVTTPLTFTGDSGSSTNKLGTTLAITGDSNITTTASQGQIAVALNKAITVDSVNAGGVTVDKNGLNAGGVTVSKDGINANGQTVTGVKDGVAASDAVNKGQLDAANAGSQAATDALGNSLAQNLGGASTYKDGVVTAPNYQITDLSGKTNTATNVGDALSSLNTAVTTPLTFTGDSGSSSNKLGSTLAIVGDDNITTTASQGQIAVALNKAITVDSINAGGVTVDKNGINANGQTITGVKDGAAASDAVNKGQLDAANAGSQAATDALGNSLAQNLGGASTYKDGVVSAPNYQITDLSGKTNTATNVGDALGSLNTAVTTPLTFTGDSGSSTNKLGTSLAVVGDDNITTTASQGQIAVALNKAITVDSLNAGGVTVDQNGLNAGGVTIGKDGINANGQTITGVKDGAAASDAVNKGQLDAANAGSQAATDALGKSLAQNLGGASTYKDGVVTAPNYQITDLSGKTNTATNVGDALSSLNTAVTTPLTFTGDSGSSINKLGTTLAITGDSNITTTASQGQIAVALNKAITVDSLNAGGVTVDQNGLNTGGVTVGKDGINANGQTITGVKDGAAASDAVNKGQLDAVNAGSQAATDALGNSIAQNLGGTSTYKDGVVTAPNYQITDLSGKTNTATNVGDALGSLNTAVTTPLTFTGDSGSSTNKLGTSLAVVGDDNITTTASQGQIAVALNKAITVDSVNAGGVTVDQNGLNAGGVTVGKNGINANGQTITGVKDGTAASDAVNKGQLDAANAGSQAATDALGNSLAQNLGGASTYKDGVVTAPNYQITDLSGKTNTATNVGDALGSLNTAVTTPLTFTGDSGSSTNKLGSSLAVVGDDNITTTASQGQIAVTLNKAISVDSVNAGGVTVDKNGINANGQSITGVKDGLAASDAVNKGQLDAANAGSQAATDALGNSLAQNLGGASTYKDGVVTAPNYQITDLSGKTNTATNVGDALSSLNTAVTTPLTFTGDSGSSINKLGTSLAVVGDSNITTTASQGQIAVALNKAITVDSLNAGGITVDKNGINANGQSITGVKDGTAASDAVNKGQLDAANAGSQAATDALGNSIAQNLGGASTYKDGVVTAPNYQITDLSGKTNTATNVGDALSSLNTAVTTPLTFTGDSGSSINKLGTSLAVVGDDNITTTASQGQIAVALNKAITVDSVNAGGVTVDQSGLNAGGVTVDQSGLNAGGVTVGKDGINANGQTITGVKDGVAASDAVNKGQLDAANAGSQAATDALGNSLAQNLGGASTYKDGVVTAPNYQITDLSGKTNTATNVGDALSSLNTAVTTPLTFTGDSGSSTNKLGTSLAVVGDDNITTTASQGKLQASLNKNLVGLNSIQTIDATDPNKVSTLTAGGTTVTDGTNTTVYGSNGLDINNGAVTLGKDGLNAGGVTVGKDGINANDKTISNVGDAVNGKDATNLQQVQDIVAKSGEGSQIATNNLGNSLAQNLGGDAKYENGVVTAPNYQITDLSGKTNTATNVGDALGSLNTAVTTPLTFTGDSGSSSNKLGSTLAVVGDENITTTASQGKLQASLNKNLVGLNSIQTIDATDPNKVSTLTAGGTTVTDGTNTTVYGSNGLDINNGAVTLGKDGLNAGGVTVGKDGINANDKTIRNVGDAVNGKDATNLQQVQDIVAKSGEGSQTATDALGNSIAQNLGGTSTYKDGVVTAPNYQITDLSGKTNTAATVGDALGSLNTAVTTPLTFTGDSGSSTNKLGTTLAITGDSNITTTASQGQIAVALNKAITVDSLNAGGVTVDKNGINANGQSITGVKDGLAASDAVNKGQLDAANAGSQAATDALGNSLAQNLGGASTYKDGVVTAPNYQITDLSGKTNTAATVGDALSSLNTAVTTPLTFTGDSGSSTNKLGTTLAITGDSNITTTASQGQIAVTLNKAITVDSVNAGGVTVSKNGINANGQTITGVKDGAAASDAVNKGQLDAANAGSQAATDALGNSIAQNLGGASTYKDGVVTAPNYQITDLSGKTNTATNVGDALGSLNTAVTTPLTFSGDSGSSTNKLGTSLAVVGDDNITTTASQGKLQASLNKNLVGLNSIQTIDATDPNKVSTLTAGGTTITDGTNTTVYGSNGLDINNGAVTVGKDGLNAGGVTVGKDGINANDKTINNVGDAVNGKDATNLQQVQDIVAKSGEGSQTATNNLGNSIAQNLGGASTYKDGVVTAPNYQITDLSGKTNTVTNVGDALSSLNTAVTTPLTFTGDSGSSTNKLGSSLAVVGDENITTTASQGKLQASLNKNLVGLNSVQTIDATDPNKVSTLTAGGTTVTDGTNTTVYGSNGLDINNGAVTLGKDGLNAGGVTVGKDGINANDKTISNVGDAVNGKDATNLQQVQDIVAKSGEGSQIATNNLGNSLAQNLGGDAKYENGVVTAPNYQITDLSGKTNTATNVGDALGSLNTAVTTPLTFTGDSGSSSNKLGSTLAVVGDENITTTASQGKLQASLNKNLVGLNSIQTIDATDPNKVSTLTAGGTTVTDGTNTTVYGSNGLDINNGAVTLGKDGLNAGGVTVGKDGINANDKTISNIGDAVNGKDATNLQQVQDIVAKAGEGSQTATNSLGNSLAQNLGGEAKYENGVVTAPNYKITNLDGTSSTAATVGDAIGSLNAAVTTPLKFSGDKGTGSSNKLGSTLAVVGDSNITTTATQDQIAVALNKDLALDSVTAGNSKLDNSGLTVKNGNNTALYGADGINLNNGAVTVNKDGLTIAGGPSVTSAGINAANKTISNVADAVNANDAVNKAQLDAAAKAQDGKSAALGESAATALGGGSKYDSATGSITAPSYNLTALDGNQSTVNSVGDAISSLNAAVTTPLTFSGDNGTGSSNKLGTNLAIIGDQNISTTATQGQLQASLNSDLKGLTSVQTVDKNDPNKVSTLTANGTQVTDGTNSTNYGANGVNINNGAVVMNNNGLIIAGGASVTKSGINAGGQTISNVGNAVNKTDAVNKGQLDNAIAEVTKDLSNLNNTAAVQYDKNADGTADKNNITLAGGTNGTAIHNVADGKVETGSKDAVNGSQLAGVRDDLQGQITQNTNDISNIKDELNNGSVGLVQQADKDATVTVAKGTGGNKVDVSGTAGDRVITGVANGAMTSGSKDAVNGSQLNATNQAVVQYLGGGAGYDNITGSFTAPTYNVSDKTYNNVGDAVTALDNADKALNNKIDNVSSRLEDAFRSTNNRIDNVEKKANAGIAAALSLESAPYVPGKYTYAAGAAYHGGESAVGVTLRKTADSGKWSLTGGAATDSQGSPSFRIGVSGVID